jgi:hypothetical protein
MRSPLPFVLLFALAAAPSQAAEIIKPGYWESTNKMLSPIRTTKVERRCITPAEVVKFVEGPSNRHYACTYPTKVFEHGKITLKGYCESKKGRHVDVKGDGTYAPTHFKLNATVVTPFLGIPVTGKVSTEARRIGDTCPPPAPPEAK